MKKLQLKTFLLFQLALSLVGSIVCFLMNVNSGVSFLFGSLVMFVGNFLMLFRFLFKRTVFQAPSEVIFLFLGEFLKLLVIAVASVLVAMYIKVSFVVYLCGLILLQAAMWMMPLFIR